MPHQICCWLGFILLSGHLPLGINHGWWHRDANALLNHEGHRCSKPGFNSIHGPSLLSISTDVFQYLHCFEKRKIVKVLTGIVLRGRRREIEPVIKEGWQLVARVADLSSTWRDLGLHRWEVWAKGGERGRQFIVQMWHFNPYSIRGVCQEPHPSLERMSY